jgi:hypothetical protein
MWAGGPAMPSPGDPQAEPTIAKAINGGFDLLEARYNRCDRVSLVPLRALRQPPDTPVWKLAAAAVLRTVQHRPLQPPAARIFSGCLCQAGSGAWANGRPKTAMMCTPMEECRFPS